ncbi:MAG TPA: dihydropteroate synthase [Rhizomicrobium sp.]|nr:dihydropteroate synthase [Rhizomicrobium sp.]
MSRSPVLLGIVNVTEDSFSDGGVYLNPDAALAHARALAVEGADIIDLGAAASNPRAKSVPPETEIARLAPLVEALKADRIKISIDSFAPETQRWALQERVDVLNDIHGFPQTEIYPALARSNTKLIVMHALRNDGPARREDQTPPNLFERILGFFEQRVAALTSVGIDRRRLILDPGMGLFLGNDRRASFEVLRRLAQLKDAFGLPILISVSRKSFLRPEGRKAAESGASTLAVELFAAAQGADYIRTHDPRALRDGLFTMRALEAENSNQITEARLL